MGSVFQELLLLQPLVASRSLVTYRQASGATASNSRDAPPATPAPAGHFPGRGSNRGCPVCSTIPVDWPACWRLGTPRWNNIFAAPDSGNQEQKSSCSANICSGESVLSSSRKSPSLKARRDDRKREEKPPPEEDGKRREEEIWTERGEENGTGRKQQFQTGVFTPFSARRCQPTALLSKRPFFYFGVRVKRPPLRGWRSCRVTPHSAR